MLVDVMIIISQLAVVGEELAGKRICLVFSWEGWGLGHQVYGCLL